MFQLDWQKDTPAAYIERAGRKPTLYGEFVEFPFRTEVAIWLGDKVEQVRAADHIFMLTLEPLGGLETVSDASLAQLAASLSQLEQGPAYRAGPLRPRDERGLVPVGSTPSRLYC